MRTPRRTPTVGAEAPPPQPSIRGRRAHAGPPADEHLGPDETGAPTTRPLTRAGLRHLRPRTVRAKIVCLLMVPVVSLLALWAYATVTTAQDVARFRQVQRVDATVRGPVADAVAALQAERVAAVRFATKPSTEHESTLRRLSQRSDRAIDALRLGDRHTIADGTDLPTGVSERLAGFVTGAEQLRALRTSVLDRRSGWADTYERYTTTISTAFGVGGALTGIQDADLGSDARVLLEFSRAGEALAQEDALLVAPASPGHSTESGCACSRAPSTPAAP